MNEFAVKVPATSANLGPGFDSLGIALAMYDLLEVKVVDKPGISVEVRGETAPADESNLIVRSLLHVFKEKGRTPPGLKLISHNNLPHGRGLGSSASAICAGVLAAQQLIGDSFSSDETLALATELEGHPDNVAPALFGGLTIAWLRGKEPAYKRLIVHRAVKPVVFIPEQRMSTAMARSLQPESVPYADAVFNLSRAALLVAALTQSPDLLLWATEDRLHQVYRASAMPETYKLVEHLRELGFAAVVSGAGPSILVLVDEPAARLAAIEVVEKYAVGAWTHVMPAVDFKGATILENLPTE